MLKNITPAQLTLIKWAGIGIAGYWVYKKITTMGAAAAAAAEEVVTVKLNPMHRDNLVHTAAENIVGAERLADTSTLIFDWLDKAAETVGIRNGINGVPGTTAELVKNTAAPAPFIVAPEAELQADIRTAGNTATRLFGENANG